MKSKHEDSLISWIGDSIDDVIFTDLDNHVDERGHLIVLLEKSWFVNSEESSNFEIGRVYMSTAGKGVIKAWHKHHIQTDRMAVVSGKVKFGLWDVREESKTNGNVLFITVSPLNPTLITIPPGIRHGFMPLEDNSIVINMPDKGYSIHDEQKMFVNPEAWKVKNG